MIICFRVEIIILIFKIFNWKKKFWSLFPKKIQEAWFILSICWVWVFVSGSTKFCLWFTIECWLNDAGQKPIRGDGYTVEIDESLMSQRKYNIGRMLSAEWILGGYCVKTKEKFVLRVPDRTAGTLLPIIEQQILPNTKISSDSWDATLVSCYIARILHCSTIK